MKREIITTSDGSVTIYLPDMKETYHSKFGAIQEAYHVFIQNGLALKKSQPVSILEIGFGTGLNAFITYLESEKLQQKIYYTGIEAYPVTINEVSKLNYVEELKALKNQHVFDHMHRSVWNEDVKMSENFVLNKHKKSFFDIDEVAVYDLIYYDAFGFHAQPELWGIEIFMKMFSALKSNGILVTYACRTSIKNAMKEAGFNVEKLPGPPGKREMLRAFKY